MKASMCLLAVALIATFLGKAYLGKSNYGERKEIEYVAPEHVEAFDLSEFENVKFTSVLPDTGANFTGENCHQLAQNFAVSLGASFGSLPTSKPDIAWDLHLEHINVLSREMSVRRLECNADQLVATIADGISQQVSSQILLSHSIIENDIKTIAVWKNVLHDLISEILEFEETIGELTYKRD